MSRMEFKAIFSTDWNQCLAPCGPFDPIVYNYPDLTTDLTGIFEAYTGNIISLQTATHKIKELLPASISILQMDTYLDNAFKTYQGVPELIEWCLQNGILFMINTTGFVGYFQRVFAKSLLPEIPVISANPAIQYPLAGTDPPSIYPLTEIEEKGANTGSTLAAFGIADNKILIMGDSGGDGPHFEWGKEKGAFKIGSMIKPSLTAYCQRKEIEIELFFGTVYTGTDRRNEEKEMQTDFKDLIPFLKKML